MIIWKFQIGRMYCHLIESSEGIITADIIREVIKKIIKAGE